MRLCPSDGNYYEPQDEWLCGLMIADGLGGGTPYIPVAADFFANNGGRIDPGSQSIIAVEDRAKAGVTDTSMIWLGLVVGVGALWLLSKGGK